MRNLRLRVGRLLGIGLFLVWPILVAAGPVWIDKSSIDVRHVLPAPPKAGSRLDQEDLEKVLRYQATRTEEDCKRARFEFQISLKAFFGPPYGPLTPAEVEKWTPFFEKVYADTKYFVKKTGAVWNRPRPFVVDSKVTPCVQQGSTRGYPSGHATNARVFAKLLAELKPRDRAVFGKRADQIAEDRVIAGVHRPADIEAGKILGDEIVKRLLANPDFRKEMNALAK
jgi:acid phosphatase (class A)